HEGVRRQRRRRHRRALEIAGWPGARGHRAAAGVGVRARVAHSSGDRAGPVRRAAKWLGVALGGLLIVIAAVGAWSLHTQTGARWIGRVAVGALGGKLA